MRDIDAKSHPDRRDVLRMMSTAGLALGAVSVATTRRGHAADPVKLAYLTPISGRFESYGKLQQQVVTLALQEVNAAGGVGGAPIELVTEDTAFNPQQAVEKVRKVAERDRVFAILGPYGSGEMDVVAPLAVRLAVPMVSTVFTKIGVPGANRPWVFRIGPNDAQVIEFACARYRAMFPNARRVAMIGNAAEPYVAATLRDHLPAGLRRHGFQLVETVEVTTGQVDYAAAVSRLARTEADLYFVQAVAGELVSIGREIARLELPQRAIVAGLQGPWAGPWLRLNPEAFQGWYAVGFFNPAAARPQVRGFIDRMTAAAGAETVRSISVETTAYDATKILAQVMAGAQLTAATPLDRARAAVRDGLAGLRDYDGVSGRLSMGSEGDAEGLEFTVFRANAGNWAPV